MVRPAIDEEAAGAPSVTRTGQGIGGVGASAPDVGGLGRQAAAGRRRRSGPPRVNPDPAGVDIDIGIGVGVLSRMIPDTATGTGVG